MFGRALYVLRRFPREEEELKKAIDEAKKQGLCVSMLTLTAPHYKGDDLADLLDKMTAAQTKLWKDKAGKRLIETYGIVGREFVRLK